MDLPPFLRQLDQWYEERQDSIIKDFFTFLSFPSISSEKQHTSDVRHCAQWLIDYLKAIGLHGELWETPGHPIVFASHQASSPGRPTLLLYHHYDVQPIDPAHQWISPPFSPALRDNKIYARGASDNKGQCFYSLTALKALFELVSPLDLNIKILIEGEEESGGHGTAIAIEQKKDLLKADHLLVIDFDILAPHYPSLTLGMRGILTAEVSCKNSATDLHSGVHGGVALNPNRALIQILSSLWDHQGRVRIPNFYSAVETLSNEALSVLDLSFDFQKYQNDFGIHAYCPEALAGEKNSKEAQKAIRTSNWLLPTVEINGIQGGYTGPGFKTVIPAVAHAKISCRLVPHQDPQKIGSALSDFLKQEAAHFPGLELQVKCHGGAAAYRTSPLTPVIQAAASIYETLFNTPCRYTLNGGSVPIVTQLAEISGGEVALIGVALESDNIHAPNEHFSLDRLKKGYLLMGGLLYHFQKDA